MHLHRRGAQLGDYEFEQAKEQTDCLCRIGLGTSSSQRRTLSTLPSRSPIHFLSRLNTSAVGHGSPVSAGHADRHGDQLQRYLGGNITEATPFVR
jgi:hypothetical protein